jgi:SAM-dependent methyltransferase
MSEEPLPPAWFRRMEEGPDEEFYRLPRKVVHLDDDAIAALREFYDTHLQDGWRVLDLMSSWRSHLPKMKRLTVTGLGMNEAEMYDNLQLDSFIVHNLNLDPALPFEDNTFDAALCAVSVQYLVRPVEVFREVKRVLKPGGPFIVSISNRCFPTKAVAAWRGSNDQQHIQLVARYFYSSDSFEDVQAEDHSPEAYVSDPLFILWGHARP